MIFTFSPAHATTVEIHNSAGSIVQDRDNSDSCDLNPTNVIHNTFTNNAAIGLFAENSGQFDCNRGWTTFEISGMPSYEYTITSVKLKADLSPQIEPDLSSLLTFDFKLMDDLDPDAANRWADIRNGDLLTSFSTSECAGCTTGTKTYTEYTLNINSHLEELKTEIIAGNDIHIGILLRNDNLVPMYATQKQLLFMADLNGRQSGHTVLVIETQPVVQIPNPPTDFNATTRTQQALTFTWNAPNPAPDNYQLNITDHNNVVQVHTVSGNQSTYTLMYDPYLSCTESITASIRSFNTGSQSNSYYSTSKSLTFIPSCVEYYSSHVEKGPPPTSSQFTYSDNPERYAPLTMSEVQGGDVLVTMSADNNAGQYDYTLYSCSGIDYPIIDRLPLFPFIAAEQSSKYTAVGLGEYIEGEQTPALIKYLQTCGNTRYCAFKSGIHYGETRLISDLTLDGLITDVKGTYTITSSGQQYSRDNIYTTVLIQNSTDDTVHNYQYRVRGQTDKTINIESEYDRDINITTSYGVKGDWGHKPQNYQGSSGLITSPLSIFHEDIGGNLLKRSYTQNAGTITDDIEKGDVLIIMGYDYSPVSTAPLTQIGYTEFQARWSNGAPEPTAKLTAYFVQADRTKEDLITVSGSIHGYLIKPLYDLNAVRHLEHGIIIPEYMLTEHSSLTCTAKKHVLHRDQIKDHTTIAHTIQYEHPAEQCQTEVHNMPNTPLTRAFDVQYEDILPDNHCSVLGNAIDRKPFDSPIPPSPVEGVRDIDQYNRDHDLGPDVIDYFATHQSDDVYGVIVFNPNRHELDLVQRPHIHSCTVSDPISGFSTVADRNPGLSESGWCTGYDYNFCHTITICNKDRWNSLNCNDSTGQAPYWIKDRQLEYTCHDIHGEPFTRSLTQGTFEPIEPFYQSVINEINYGTALGWGGESGATSTHTPFLGIGILGALSLLSGMAAFSRWNIIASIILFILLLTAMSFLGFITLSETIVGAIIVFAILGIMGRMFR